METVSNFITEFRTHLGDTDCDIPQASIISWLNNSLRSIAKEPGLDKLFLFRDTFTLASINDDGTNAAAWVIKKQDTTGNQTIPTIIKIEQLTIVDTSGCAPVTLNSCFSDFRDFFMCNPVPESNQPGVPGEFTVEQIQGKTKVIFDRPIDRPVSLIMLYSAFHPRLRTVNDTILIPDGYWDVLIKIVAIHYYLESADAATARALYEDYDLLVAESRELLAKLKSGITTRTIKGGF